MAEDQPPKIIVDDDWKSQARAEKEKMAREEAAKASARQPAKGGAEDDAVPPRDPGEPIGFLDLVRMLATQALMYLGQFPDPQTGRAVVALDIAKVNIDLLVVLTEKTKGNLTAEEKSLLERTTHELRMAFVEIAQEIQRAAGEGRIGPDGTMRMPGPPGAPGTPGIPGSSGPMGSSGPRGMGPTGRPTAPGRG